MAFGPRQFALVWRGRGRWEACVLSAEELARTSSDGCIGVGDTAAEACLAALIVTGAAQDDLVVSDLKSHVLKTRVREVYGPQCNADSIVGPKASLLGSIGQPVITLHTQMQVESWLECKESSLFVVAVKLQGPTPTWEAALLPKTGLDLATPCVKAEGATVSDACFEALGAHADKDLSLLSWFATTVGGKSDLSDTSLASFDLNGVDWDVAARVWLRELRQAWAFAGRVCGRSVLTWRSGSSLRQVAA